MDLMVVVVWGQRHLPARGGGSELLAQHGEHVVHAQVLGVQVLVPGTEAAVVEEAAKVDEVVVVVGGDSGRCARSSAHVGPSVSMSRTCMCSELTELCGKQ